MIVSAEFAAQVRPDELRFIGVLVGLLDGPLGNAWRDAPPFQLPQDSLGPERLILTAKVRIRFRKIRIIEVSHLGQSPDDFLHVFRPSRPAAETRAKLGSRQRAPPQRSNRVFIQRFNSQQGGASGSHGVILPCTATTLLGVRIGATPNYGTVRELAEILAVSEKTVYAWVAEGLIRYCRLQSAIRFRPAIIRAWIQEKEYLPRELRGGHIL